MTCSFQLLRHRMQLGSFISLVVLIRFSVRWNFQFVSAALHAGAPNRMALIVLLELMRTHTKSVGSEYLWRFLLIFRLIGLRVAIAYAIKMCVFLRAPINRSSDVSFACRLTKLRPVNLKGPRRNHQNNNSLASHTTKLALTSREADQSTIAQRFQSIGDAMAANDSGASSFAMEDISPHVHAMPHSENTSK